MFRIRRLPKLAIDPGLELESVGITHFIRSRNPRSHRAMRIIRLPHRERRHAQLPIPDRHIVRNRVARDDLVSPVPWNVSTPTTP